jgi:hypothetical protein
MRRPPMANRSQLPRLLAGRNRLGRDEKEAVLEEVLSAVAPRRRARRWFALAVPALALAALVLWLVPRSQPASEFTARGGDAHVATFAPKCNGECTQGSKLLFDLQGTTGYRYFAAFAKTPDGSVIWYASGRDLTRELEHGVLVDAIVLGDHQPGRYRVFGVFSDRELSRDAIRELFDDQGRARLTAGVTVVEREVVIR